jgi:hypothetical protein
MKAEVGGSMQVAGVDDPLRQTLIAHVIVLLGSGILWAGTTVAFPIISCMRQATARIRILLSRLSTLFVSSRTLYDTDKRPTTTLTVHVHLYGTLC